MKAATRKIIFYSISFILLALCSSVLFYAEYKNRIDDSLNAQTREMDISIKAVINSFGLLSAYFCEDVLDIPQIATILQTASICTKEEKDALRKKLYEQLKKDYENLKKKNIGELHFHLNNSESFLIFSRPHEYGEKLATFRESFKIIGRRTRSIFGYEAGPHGNGFRYIYPFHKDGKFAGSVETCISYDAIRSQLSKIFPFETSLILNNRVFSNATLKKSKDKNYILSDISPDYFYTKSILDVKRGRGENGISADEITRINSELKKTQSLGKKLAEGNSFAVCINSNKTDYAVIFIPINDISGHHNGYTVSYSKDATASEYFRTFIEKSIALNSAFFLLVLLLFLRDVYRTRIEGSRDALRSSREMFESMAANVPGIIYRWYQRENGDCGYSYVSPRAKDILGISAKALVRDYKLLEIHPDDFDRWKDTVNNAYRNKTDWNYEGRFILPNRKIMWWSGGAKTVLSTEDEIIFDGIIIDITSQKEAELKIRKNEERLRKVLESMPVLLIALDNKMNIITWNRECEKVTGFHRDEITNNPDAFETMYPDNYEHIREVFCGHDDFLDAEFDIICKDGSTSTIKWSKVSSKVEITGWSSWLIGVNVTHRKETEEALWQRDLLLGATSQIGTLLLSAFDPDAAVRQSLELVGPVTDVDVINIFECRVNDSTGAVTAEIQYEWASSTAAEKTDTTRMLHSLPLSERFADWLETLRNGGCVSGTTSSFPSEQWKFFSFLPLESLLCTPIILHGKLWGFVIYYDCHFQRTWTDNESTILETVGCTIGGAILRQRAESNLDEARKKAEAATNAKTEFIANMSHDIRTPLNGIVGMAQILGSTTLLPEQKQYVETMLLSSELLLSIINDILDLSKIEAGKLEIEESPFNLKLTLAKLYEIMNFQAKKKDVSFLYEYGEGCPEDVIGDEVRVRQIVMNLLGNALKFTHEGYVKLFVESPLATLADEKREFIIRVEDTGIGISKDKIGRLFEKYTQEEISTTRIYGGTGLGLSICKMLAEKMGGVISIESNKGSGSLFTLRLPMRPSTEKVIQVREDLKLNWKQAPVILVVDDSDINQRIAVALLEKNGCRTDTAGDGQEAVEKLFKNNYDLVLMDILMPIMDGIEATSEIRKMQGDLKNIPIVAMTANVIHTERERCLSSGMDDYLSKPVQEIELKKMLMRNLEDFISGNVKDIPPALAAASSASLKTEGGKRENAPPSLESFILFDPDTAITAIGGNRDFYVELLKIFIEDSRDDVKSLEIFLTTGGDTRLASKTAHKIKGEAASIGAPRLNKAAIAAESAGKEADAKKLNDAIASVRTIFEETCSEIEKYLRT
ncbi:MAG: hypothetical protein A2020_05475 [Lentisphaerae bacterium GWF2_45_14]|nr:MAG: hypothetical protein A2020_05475 [Lentisphaerae bacterium GWF2_45_14]